MRIFFVSRVNDLKNILAISHKTSDIALFLSNTFKLEYLTLYQKIKVPVYLYRSSKYKNVSSIFEFKA